MLNKDTFDTKKKKRFACTQRYMDWFAAFVIAQLNNSRYKTISKAESNS